MFSYSCYLLLGELAQHGVNIPFLAKNGYELSKCNYSFDRGIDYKGEVRSKSKGGQFELGIMGLPTNEIIEWAMRHDKYKDGAIIFCDDQGMILEKIDFTKAACIAMSINYVETGNAYTSCDLILSANVLKIGSVNFSNEWLNVK